MNNDEVLQIFLFQIKMNQFPADLLCVTLQDNKFWVSSWTNKISKFYIFFQVLWRKPCPYSYFGIVRHAFKVLICLVATKFVLLSVLLWWKHFAWKFGTNHCLNMQKVHFHCWNALLKNVLVCSLISLLS